MFIEADMFLDGGELSVGNPEIDREHSNLFNQAEKINISAIEGISSEQLLPYYEKYLADIAAHFDNEELVMAPHNLPNIEAHKDERRALIRNLTNIKEGIVKGRQDMISNTRCVL